MAEFVATMTSKGQLTVPVAVRRTLGLDAGDQVAFVINDEGGASLRRVEHTTQSVRGIIPTPPWLPATVDFDELIEEAMSDHADNLMRRTREGQE